MSKNKSELTGFRLERMELYNWGTFNQKIYKLLESSVVGLSVENYLVKKNKNDS